MIPRLRHFVKKKTLKLIYDSNFIETTHFSLGIKFQFTKNITFAAKESTNAQFSYKSSI